MSLAGEEASAQGQQSDQSGCKHCLVWMPQVLGSNDWRRQSGALRRCCLAALAVLGMGSI